MDWTEVGLGPSVHLKLLLCSPEQPFHIDRQVNLIAASRQDRCSQVLPVLFELLKLLVELLAHFVKLLFLNAVDYIFQHALFQLLLLGHAISFLEELVSLREFLIVHLDEWYLQGLNALS